VDGPFVASLAIVSVSVTVPGAVAAYCTVNVAVAFGATVNGYVGGLTRLKAGPVTDAPVIVTVPVPVFLNPAVRTPVWFSGTNVKLRAAGFGVSSFVNGAPVPVIPTLSGEFVASLVIPRVAVSCVPADVGVNCTLNVVVPFGARGIEPVGWLVRTKSVFPATDAALIVTVAFPVFVIVVVSVVLVFTSKFPKGRLVGAADNVLIVGVL
jgi:hypothetical protein